VQWLRTRPRNEHQVCPAKRRDTQIECIHRAMQLTDDIELTVKKSNQSSLENASSACFLVSRYTSLEKAFEQK